MKEKIVRGTVIVLVTILVAVIFFRWVDTWVMADHKSAQIAKNELTEHVEKPATAVSLSYVVETEKETVVEVEDEVKTEIEMPVVEEFEPMVSQDAEVVEYPKLYTHEDVIAMAKLLYGEARGVQDLYIWDGRVVSSEYQKACVIWSVLNRYDRGWEDTITGVAAAYMQYHGYDEDHPVEEDLVILAYDVLERWNREQHGETEVGRVLPPEYIYFYGDMKNNYFMDEYGDWDKYDWDLEDPYV